MHKKLFALKYPFEEVFVWLALQNEQDKMRYSAKKSPAISKARELATERSP